MDTMKSSGYAVCSSYGLSIEAILYSLGAASLLVELCRHKALNWVVGKHHIINFINCNQLYHIIKTDVMENYVES